jgi:hypothetical protein
MRATRRGGSGLAELLFWLWTCAHTMACVRAPSFPSPQPAPARFRTTCWECRFGQFASRRFSVRQCRAQRGHTSIDWPDDAREQQDSTGATAGNATSPASVRGRGRAQRRRWQAQFEELQRFKAAHGHCHVAQGGRAYGGSWCRLARCVCVCVRARVRACMLACVRAYVSSCLRSPKP